MTNTRRAAAAAIALSFVAGISTPLLAQEDIGPNDITDPHAASGQLYFDLGIDATQLPQDIAGAKAFYHSQVPETQRVLLAACENYMKHPTDAEMPQTMVFCRAITTQ